MSDKPAIISRNTPITIGTYAVFTGTIVGVAIWMTTLHGATKTNTTKIAVVEQAQKITSKAITNINLKMVEMAATLKAMARFQGVKIPEPVRRTGTDE